MKRARTTVKKFIETFSTSYKDKNGQEITLLWFISLYKALTPFFFYKQLLIISKLIVEKIPSIALVVDFITNNPLKLRKNK